jgi:acylphosphatase
MTNAASAFHAVITGRVQGVGFRWRARETAQSLHIKGWVRNNADGTVETWAEGEKTALDQFLSWLQQGPSYARVDHVDYEWCAPCGKYRGFDAR